MIYAAPTNPRPVLYSDSATLYGRHFTVESLIVQSGANKTFTLPTPTRELAGKATWFVHNGTGTLTLSGAFPTGSSHVMDTKSTLMVVCLPVTSSTYKWHGIGTGGIATGLTEGIQDIIGAMMTSTNTETGVTLTYQDSTGDFDVAVVYASSGITTTATTSTSVVGTADTSARGDHQHGIGTHTHAGSTTGGTVAHTDLTSIGTNTHAQIDTFISTTVPAYFNTSTGHDHDGSDSKKVTWANIDKATSSIADITTKSHTALSDIGTNTHAQIDTFIGTTVPAYFNTSSGHDHDGTDSKYIPITSVTSGSAWTAYVPTVTWTDTVAPASVTTVARYSRTWNTVDFVVDLSGADGDDAIIEGITIPVASATTADFPVVAQALVNTTYSQPYGLVEAAAFPRTSVTVQGAFAADSDWDKGAGWSIGAGVATHLTANATALNETVSTVVSGVTYRLTFTTTVTDAGTLTPSAGGVTLTGRTTADTFTEDFTATSTAALTFTADAGWGGTIDNVSLQPLTPVGVIFRAPVTLTNSQPWHIKVYGRYEVV